MLKRKKEKTEQPEESADAPLVAKVKRRKVASGRRKASNKKQAFVAFVGDDGTILLYVRGNKVLRRLFAPTSMPEHMQSIIEIMQKQPEVPLYVMLDTIDQQYVRQTFPPVSALSVSKLVNRRLQRDFPKEDIKGAIPLGRESGGRREWSYLLISLAYTDSLKAWLDVLLEMPNECKGLYLTAVEGQQYAPEIMREAMPDATGTWQLFVSHNKVGGVRQIVLHNGKLTFTRLTQSSDENNPELTAGNIEQEIQNTIDYLRRLDFDNNADMSMLVISAQEVNEHLDLARFGVGSSATLTPFDAANLLNLEQAALSGDRYGDAVMGAAFATSKKHMLPLFTKYAQKIAYVYKARLAGKILAGLIGAYAIFSSGESLLTWLNNSQEESVVAEELQAKSAQLNQLQESINALDSDVALWSSVVTLYDTYEPLKYIPLPFVANLAGQLEQDTRITKIDWTAPYETEEAARARRTPRRGQTQEPSKGPVTVTVEVEFLGDYENQNAYVDAANNFFRRLAEGMPDYTVTSTNLPGKKNPDEQVVIDFTNTEPEPFKKGENKVTFVFDGPIENTDAAKGGAQ